METMFEIVYTETEEMYRQAYARSMRTFVIIWSVIVIVCAIEFFWAWYMFVSWTYFVGAVVLLLLLPWFLLAPSRTARNVYKNRLKYYDGDIPQTTALFSDQIVFQANDGSVSVPYHKIRKIHMLESYIGLEAESRIIHIIARDGFTKGDATKLLLFLKEKCPGAKITN